MKKIFVSLVATVTVFASSAQAADIATVLGAPTTSVDFMRAMDVEITDLKAAGQASETHWTTKIYSILAQRGVTSAAAISVITDNLGLSGSLINRGFDLASRKAGVVFTGLGGTDAALSRMCAILAQKPNVAFVLAAGKYADVPEYERHCSARNILRVTALNSELTDIAVDVATGNTVRLAAPSGLLVTDHLGLTSTLTGTSAAAAFAAAELSLFKKANPRLEGGALIDAFLTAKTVALNSLNGKVNGSRALIAR